jgi:hypothetical protein
VSGREREGEAGPCGTDGPKEGAGPCGEHGPHGKGKKRGGREVGRRAVGLRELLGRGLEKEKGRGKSGLGVLFFFKYFFLKLQKFKLFQNFSTFKLFSKNFKLIFKNF